MSYLLSSNPNTKSEFSFKRYPNVAISGLTAAGKTTHAILLAQSLGYRYVSATEVLLELTGVSSTRDRAWFDEHERLQEARESGEVDDELDRRLVQLAAENEGLVIDSWGIAWTCQAPMVRVWLDSDATSRTWKCYVSQGNPPQYDLYGCAELVSGKDISTRNMFLKRHGFDIFGSRDIFDVILDNTHLIREPTQQSANQGIKEFEPVMFSAVSSLLNEQPDILTSAAYHWNPQQRHCISHISRSDLS
ncbi:cytidylate kinase family protein [Actinopolyspora lacussalsi]|uniref:cytidylate kinase family protein n=1 Tax=Actinopolyspora righensis TaxID=995060 RepID=UPI0011135372|nr:cytidylate kinase family protein [Actinopolyspora righensis]